MLRKGLFKVSFNILLYAHFFFLSSFRIYPQEYKISGRIFDKSTGSTLSFVSVYDRISSKGVLSDETGYFDIILNKGRHILEFSYTGYEKTDTGIMVSGDQEISVSLKPLIIPLKEVVISADKIRDHVSSSQMNTFSLTNAEMMILPSLFGEIDPIKLLQLTPGVQAGSEGNIGFYVRGGGTDQNLTLYDNTIIYNPGHLLGFFSVFNPDILKEVNIIKSGIPAQYGGKISSVVNLNTFRGNKDSLEIKGSAGLISSRITLDGPLLNKKGTFILGARRTYLELFMDPLLRTFVKNSTFLYSNNIYRFYDLNAGLSLNISKNDIILFSGYYGRDLFKMGTQNIKLDNSLVWGNTLSSLQWTHKINNSSEWNTHLSRTRYEFNLNGSKAEYFFGLFSSVQDYCLKSIVSFQTKKHTNKTGLELIDHHFVPNKIDAETGDFIVNFGQFSEMNALEGGVFIDDKFNLSQRIMLSAGLRFSFFNHLGPYTKYNKNSLGQISDTIYYPKGKSLADYYHAEPRLILKYQMNNTTSLKISYMRIAQYIHLATSASTSLPTDIWIPSTSEIKPQKGDQVSLGFFKNLPFSGYEFTSEIYYKRMNNQIELLRGIIYNSLEGILDENMAFGFGRSYGAELYLNKYTGKTTGWISYTLSRSERKFEEINDGLFYPAKYDRRHQLSLTLIRKLNQKWTFSAIFIYVTGNAFTLPVGRYIIQGNVINEYGEVNSFRMPPYHRMDVSFNRKVITKRNWSSELAFSVYNLYCRANPYFVYFEADGKIENYTLVVKPIQVSLFPVIPSVSWNFNF